MTDAPRDEAKAILNELRWSADRVVDNHFGERVWLKQIEGGITDCCPEDSPCDYHKRLTHPATGTIQ